MSELGTELDQLLHRRKRPVVVTLLCVLMMIALLRTAILLVAHRGQDVMFTQHGIDPNDILAIVGCSAFINVIGLWKMRKWALYVYAGRVLFWIWAVYPSLPMLSGTLIGLWVCVQVTTVLIFARYWNDMR